jgi:hypothetical protein
MAIALEERLPLPSAAVEYDKIECSVLDYNYSYGKKYRLIVGWSIEIRWGYYTTIFDVVQGFFCLRSARSALDQAAKEEGSAVEL